ncbi:MAG TPA: ABC transporter substrate-binding protein [Hyphomicrobiaceae bacterium]|nr:ABC transporter substrate-binding protein [Hyphomicrobiaceae bacterium]
MLNRRTLFAVSVIAVAAAAPASAQQKTMTLAGYGGSFEKTMREQIIPPFEAKHGVKVEYVAGNSTDTLAKLQAQKGNQVIDVIIVDDGPMYQAVDLGFCGTLADAAVYSDVYSVMKFQSNKAIGVGMVGTGIMYNKQIFEENKWPAPTSWEDLKDPKFKKKLVIPPMNNTYGLHAVVMMARVRGGGEANIEPGFKAFKDDIGPSVLAYEPSPGKMTELFQSKQAVIGVWGSGRAKALGDQTGFPIEFIYPKEGGVALGVASCPIAGSKNDKEAQAFVQHLVSPEVQVILATGAGFGPTNQKVSLKPEQTKGIPYGDQVKALKAVDWSVINKAREEWNKRWTREIER